jgi:hypothetical protein
MNEHFQLFACLGNSYKVRFLLPTWQKCAPEKDGWNALAMFLEHYGFEQNLREVINDPQARANDCFVAFDHPTYGRIEVLANPVKLSKTPATIKMAPEFGQRTEEVLLEHGYSWEDISQLKQQGVIG